MEGAGLFNGRDCCGLYDLAGRANARFVVLQSGQRALVCTVTLGRKMSVLRLFRAVFYIQRLCFAVDLHNVVNV